MDLENLKTITLRFYEELNDFLSFTQKKTDFNYQYSGNQNIKTLIEAIGVPHTEIDLILVNGKAVTFNYRPKEGDRISVYPVFESLDISPLVQLRPKPLRILKFVLDAHLGKLARYLRLLGFDTLFSPDYQDDEIVDIALQEKRIALTRDKGLLKNNKLSRGYWVRKTNPKEQLQEVLQRFELGIKTKPFTRCLECNGKLITATKDQVKKQLPAKTIQYYKIFHRCRGCGKIYWDGSHYQKMKQFVEAIVIK